MERALLRLDTCSALNSRLGHNLNLFLGPTPEPPFPPDSPLISGQLIFLIPHNPHKLPKLSRPLYGRYVQGTRLVRS